MKLHSFSVQNFRSITQANKIPFEDITILLGKNNEGKSNMLRALKICMNILNNEFTPPLYRFRDRGDYISYNWNRDFPISMQSKTRNLESIFRLEFELNDNDIKDFKEKIGSNLNGLLPIEIKIGKEGEKTIQVVKNGKGSKTLNLKSKKIREYISEKIQFNYIPSIRTDRDSLETIEQILHKKLKNIENNKEYIEAMDLIKKIHQPIINELQDNIEKSLKNFLPNVKSVSIESQDERRPIYRRQYDIFIDDGTKTSIEFKGDGVKSLAAIGILKDIRKTDCDFSLIAIEEPESHLHPGAIHILKETIFDLAKNNQVIVSTHNPIFVNRDNIHSNIIIENGNVRATKNVGELRKLLGIKASDNLINASYVLLVEGDTDVVSLKYIFQVLSPTLSKALKSNHLLIDSAHGSSNIPYKLSLLSNALCKYHVLLDNDDAGLSTYDKLIENGLLKPKDVTLTICQGMKESEFEDCLNVDVYKKSILDEYGIDLNIHRLRGNNKWSNRIKDLFSNLGKAWSSKIETNVKTLVANSVQNYASHDKILCPHKGNSIKVLINNLENLLNHEKNIF